MRGAHYSAALNMINTHVIIDVQDKKLLQGLRNAQGGQRSALPLSSTAQPALASAWALRLTREGGANYHSVH